MSVFLTMHAVTLAFAFQAPCDVGTSPSRWLPDAGVEPIATYGTGENEWLVRVEGIASHPDGVDVYDPGLGSVVRLDRALVRRSEVGRTGKGPGEFKAFYVPFFPVAWTYNHAASTGDRFAVYDGVQIEWFDAAGEHLGQSVPPGADRSSLKLFGLRYLRFGSSGQLYLAVDSLVAREARRSLETWVLDGPDADARHLWSLPLPPKDRAGEHAREARPLWALGRECVVAVDGSSSVLHVFVLPERRALRIPLPDHPVPAFGTLPV
ncbi:MAG: hypothetical protein RQ745_12795, partial [Longimicrobiales bacterium]|nr:hypothetical protein [Longimicrobiales bacterium]